jgi:hypothetical protein
MKIIRGFRPISEYSPTAISSPHVELQLNMMEMLGSTWVDAQRVSLTVIYQHPFMPAYMRSFAPKYVAFRGFAPFQNGVTYEDTREVREDIQRLRTLVGKLIDSVDSDVYSLVEVILDSTS